MEEHNFVYNYGFLDDWFRANPKIQRNDVLEIMGMGDYNTLHNWTTGKTMMTLTQMMKFCNRFNVPITAFFFDEKANDESIFTPIIPNAIIKPKGGWPDASRKAGIKVCDPRCDEHISSSLPGYVHSVTTQSEIKESNSGETLEEDERKRYLSIIENLSNHILELSRINERILEQENKECQI